MHPLEGPVEVKLYADGGRIPESREVIAIFHRWIQTGALPELLTDVADYSHVHRGPGILLLGEDARYGFDQSDGRPGLATRRHRGSGESARERLRDVLARALRAASLLSRDAQLGFRTDELRLRVHDRLRAPDRKGTFDDCAAELTAFFAESGRDVASLAPAAPPGEPFTVRVLLERALELDDVGGDGG